MACLYCCNDEAKCIRGGCATCCNCDRVLIPDPRVDTTEPCNTLTREQDGLRQTAHTQRMTIEKGEEQLDEARAEVERLEAELNRIHRHRAKLETDLKEARAENERLKEQRDQADKQLVNVGNERAAFVEAENERLRAVMTEAAGMECLPWCGNAQGDKCPACICREGLK